MKTQNWRRRQNLSFGFAALVLTLFSASAQAQITLTIAKDVKVHAAAGLRARRISGLPPGRKVTLVSERRRGKFFNVRMEDGSTGWVHGKYLLLPDIPETETGGPEIVMAAGQPSFPLCGPARHYRWSAKISTSGFSQTPGSRTVSAVLGFAVLPFSGHDLLSWCQPRTTKETKAYFGSGLGATHADRN